MAKGLRASSKKANKSIIRSRIFGPVEEQRNQRLSAKLIELASQSNATAKIAGDMLEDAIGITNRSKSTPVKEAYSNGKDVRNDQCAEGSTDKDAGVGSQNRIGKRRHGKDRTTMTFPAFRKGRKVSLKTRGNKGKNKFK